jgi:hypothetical protein
MNNAIAEIIVGLILQTCDTAQDCNGAAKCRRIANLKRRSREEGRAVKLGVVFGQ